ncbi:hypothetical protein [Stenotrophomonas sp. TWI587]|uniref:hypothetical protein n=1 Tax=Stenotrophomonas sp. TWI587 TaxID=3136783 RepID=UPI00320AB431
MKNSVPTERQVLRCIFKMYESSFPAEGPNIGKTMIAIDIKAVSKNLGCDQNILFGYLYYHLDHKYRYKTGENSSVHLFAPAVGQLRNAVNLPYLTAILAAQEQEHTKFAWSLGVSLVALALSVGAIIAQLLTTI